MLGIIVWTILIALLVNIVLKKFHLPTIIGYIFTGTIIAYSFELHDAVHNQELKEIAEFGIVFLMFTIGLEFSVEHLKRMRKEVFVTGNLQIFITAFILVILSILIFDFDFKTAMIVGSALCLSSTAIVLKTFNETKEINKSYGQRVLGILIMQDIVVIPILLMITFFATQNQSVSSILVEAAISALFLLFILFVVGKYLLDPFLYQITKTGSDELFVGSVLFIAIGASYMAHSFGFSYSLGALVAGMLISETKYKHQVEADLIPFRNILLGVFFITVGMQINFMIIAENYLIILVLLPSILALKFLIIYLILRRDETKRVSFKAAISIIQIGEFSLAIFELARSQNLLDPQVSQVLIVTAVLSMIITPLILKNLSKLSAKLIQKDVLIQCNNIIVDQNKKDQIVVLGYGKLGQEIARELTRQGASYIIIENNIKYFQLGTNRKEPIIFGNASNKHILTSVNIEQASAVIVAVDNPEQTFLICQAIDELTKNAKTVVKVAQHSEKIMLKNLHLHHFVIETKEVSKALVKEALRTE